MAQAHPPQTRAEPAVYGSLAMNALLQQLEEGRKYTVLDLGEPCGQNVNFWSQFPVKIYLPDFYRGFVSTVSSPPDGESPDGANFEQLLPYEAECRFDIILGWDLFNYLEQEPLEGLIRRLRSFCHPGTYIFLLISTLPQIPIEPIQFRIQDREHLIYDNPKSETKPWPRYQPRDIKLLMAGFEVLSSFLLRHGMHEYLFVCR